MENVDWRFGATWICDQETAEEIYRYIESKADLRYRRRCPLAKFLKLVEKEKYEEEEKENGREVESP
jgi:hypothetical protein